MKLADLLVGVELTQPLGKSDIEITSVTYDSRQVRPGALFVAIQGEKVDGNRFVCDAIRQGARAIVSRAASPSSSDCAVPSGVEWAQVTHQRRALSTIGANFYGQPADALKLVGVTGTNGKTTTTYLIDSILRAAGHRTGLFGTIAYRTPVAEHAAKNTTPESLDLQSFLAEVRDNLGSYAVMETSSHALVLERLWGCHFEVAVFTNLTRDHLDFHKTFEDYFAAKRLLFEASGANRPAVGVVNTDDPYGKHLVGAAERTLSYGLENGPNITTKKFELSFSGLEFTAATPEGKFAVRSPLVGRINVYNILAAIGAGIALGVPREHILAGVDQLSSVPGRFERVDLGQPFLVVVDYAHTDDALKNLIATARELGRDARVITLFGCGGERDRTKRPLMGEVAGRRSDLVVLTSDNPRSEDPLLIINDALVGLQRTDTKYIVEPDREAAIEQALDEARAGDIVLLAGKGHETYQVLKTGSIDFDDREMARRALRRRGFGNQTR